MYEWMIVYEAMTQVSHRPNILAYSYTSGVGTSCGLGGGQGVLGGVDKTMLISNEINKDRIHTYMQATMG